jgi:hypothetical protein
MTSPVIAGATELQIDVVSDVVCPMVLHWQASTGKGDGP